MKGRFGLKILHFQCKWSSAGYVGQTSLICGVLSCSLIVHSPKIHHDDFMCNFFPPVFLATRKHLFSVVSYCMKKKSSVITSSLTLSLIYLPANRSAFSTHSSTISRTQLQIGSGSTTDILLKFPDSSQTPTKIHLSATDHWFYFFKWHPSKFKGFKLVLFLKLKDIFSDLCSHKVTSEFKSHQLFIATHLSFIALWINSLWFFFRSGTNTNWTCLWCFALLIVIQSWKYMVIVSEQI